MNLHKMKPALLILSSLILGLLSASIAAAQSPWRFGVRDHADNLVHLARSARQETLHVAKYSQMLGPMLGEIGVLESNAAVLKAWAPHRDACYLLEQAEKIHHRIHRLDSQLEVARVRSQSGLDRPMVHCGELERLIQSMEREVSHIIQDLPRAHRVIGTPVVPATGYNYRNTGPIVLQQPGYQFGGPSVRFSTGSGLQIQLNLGGKSNRNNSHQDRHHRSGQSRQHSQPHFNHGVVSPGPARAPAKKNAQQGNGVSARQGTNIYGGVARVQSLGKTLAKGSAAKSTGNKGAGGKGSRQGGKRH